MIGYQWIPDQDRDIKRISWDIMGYVDIMVVDMDGYKGDQISNWIYPRIYPIYPIRYPVISRDIKSSYTCIYQIISSHIPKRYPYFFVFPNISGYLRISQDISLGRTFRCT